MSAMDEVTRIKADIAKLPEAYQGLIVDATTWVSKNEMKVGYAILIFGFALGFVAGRVI